MVIITELLEKYVHQFEIEPFLEPRSSPSTVQVPPDIPVPPSDGLSGCRPNDIGVVAPALGYQAVGVLGHDAVLLVPLLAMLPLPAE